MNQFDSVCRICLDALGDLIAPCQCSGSVRFIHQTCLKRWIFSQSSPESGPKCELCSAPYKLKVTYGKKCALNDQLAEEDTHCAAPAFLLSCILIICIVTFFLLESIQIEEDSENQEYL